MQNNWNLTENWRRVTGWFLLGFFAILTVSCGLFPQKQLEKWKGFHREELIQVMGLPTRVTDLPNGGQRLEYIQRITQRPSAAQVYGSTYECHKIFEIDSRGTIQAVAEKGC